MTYWRTDSNEAAVSAIAGTETPSEGIRSPGTLPERQSGPLKLENRTFGGIKDPGHVRYFEGKTFEVP